MLRSRARGAIKVLPEARARTRDLEEAAQALPAPPPCDSLATSIPHLPCSLAGPYSSDGDRVYVSIRPHPQHGASKTVRSLIKPLDVEYITERDLNETSQSRIPIKAYVPLPGAATQ